MLQQVTVVRRVIDKSVAQNTRMEDLCRARSGNLLSTIASGELRMNGLCTRCIINSRLTRLFSEFTSFRL